MAHEIEITDDADRHLKELEAGERSAVLLAIYDQLSHAPGEVTRNRKRMRPNPIAPWVLRVGRLRVYYEVNEPELLVTVRAVGIKERTRVTIGGLEVDLS